jgi:serine/threonine protein kinase
MPVRHPCEDMVVNTGSTLDINTAAHAADVAGSCGMWCVAPSASDPCSSTISLPIANMAVGRFNVPARILAIVSANGWMDATALEAPLRGLAVDDVTGAIGALRAAGMHEERIADIEAILWGQSYLVSCELLGVVGAVFGIGWVFSARHLDSGKPAVVTVIPWSDPVNLRRFQHEARLLTTIRHGNLASVLDAGETDGYCYLAVERVEGQDLGGIISDVGELPEGTWLRLVRQLATGLAALAACGITHPLVTPQILRVPSIPKEGEAFSGTRAAKVVDAGLLRGLSGNRHELDDSSDYLAPEQVRGLTIDQRTVVYNLGAILYHTLTGTPPFVRSSPELVREAHLSEMAPDLARVIPDVRSETRRLVAAALSKVPGERFASIDTFITACDRAIAEKAPTAATKAPTATSDDPFAEADAGAEPRADGIADVTSRILAKHAAIKAVRGVPSTSIRRRTDSTATSSATSTLKPDVVMGIITGNGWLGPESREQLRDLLDSRAATQALKRPGGVPNLLAVRGILTPHLARELELILLDHGFFPRYRIIRLLGSGRVGRSYLALDLSTGTDVAFTVFRQPDPDKRQRFLDEFTTLEKIRSRRIARALACGANGEVCFAAWSLVVGEPLARVIADKRIASEVRALRIALQIAEGLAYVNVYTSRCHLAVRPENVLVHEKDGERLSVVVTDFGLAEQISDFRGVDSDWLGPEQANGVSADLRSDIHAVGAILRRMLGSLGEGADADAVDLARFHPLTQKVVITSTCAESDGRYPDYKSFIAVLSRALHELGYVEKDELPDNTDPAAGGAGTRLLRRDGTGRRERDGDKDGWIG